MLLKFLSVLITVLSSTTSLWARATAIVESEFDAFKHDKRLTVSKAVQFLDHLASNGQVDDIISIINKGDGVHGFNKQGRKLTEKEEQIVLNALFFAKKKAKAESFPFLDPVDAFGTDKVKRHRHFVQIAWRLLDPGLGHVATYTDFIKDHAAYRKFRQVVKDHLSFEESPLDVMPYYFDNVGRVKQYTNSKLPKAPLFHAYHINWPGEMADSYTIYFSSRVKLPTEVFRKHLPSDIQADISSYSDPNVDMFVVSQNLPWRDEVDILFRPQYWLDPDVPYACADYNHEFEVTWQAFPSKKNTITGKAGPFVDTVNTHSLATDQDPHQIVSSPNNASAGAIFAGKRRSNFSFFTVTKVNRVVNHQPQIGFIQTEHRCAVTLHIMLRNETQHKLTIKHIQGLIRANKWYERPDFSENGFAGYGFYLSEFFDRDPELNQLYRLGF